MVSYHFFGYASPCSHKGKGPVFCLIKSPNWKKNNWLPVRYPFCIDQTPVLFVNSRFSDSITMSCRFISVFLGDSIFLFGWSIEWGIYPVTLGSVLPHRNMRYWWKSKNVGLIRNGSRRWDENSTQLALHVLIPCHMNPIISPSYHNFNWLNPLKSHPHWWNPINLQPLFHMFSDEIPSTLREIPWISMKS